MPGVWTLAMKRARTVAGWIALLTYLIVGVGAARAIGPRPGADGRIAAGATPDGVSCRVSDASSQQGLLLSRDPRATTEDSCFCCDALPIGVGDSRQHLVPDSGTSLKKKLTIFVLAGFADATSALDQIREDLLPPTSPAVDRTLSSLRSVVLLL